MATKIILRASQISFLVGAGAEPVALNLPKATLPDSTEHNLQYIAKDEEGKELENINYVVLKHDGDKHHAGAADKGKSSKVHSKKAKRHSTIVGVDEILEIEGKK